MKRILFFFLLLVACNSSDRLISKSSFEQDYFKSLPEVQKRIYLDSLIVEVDIYKNDSIKSNLLLDIANEYFNLKDNSASFKASSKAYQTALVLKDSFTMGRSLYYMGDCFEDFKKDSAYYYYKESEKIFRLLKNEDRLAKVQYNKAYLLFYEGNYTESEIEVIKALQNLKSSSKKLHLYRCYSLQGSNHLELGEFAKALNYFKQASEVLQLMNEEENATDASYDYNIVNTLDICMVYDKMGLYSKSIRDIKNLITTYNLELYPKLKYIVFGNLGYSLMKNGNYVEAEHYITQALSFVSKENSSKSYMYLTIDYGEYKLLTKDFIAAKALFIEALTIAKKLKSGKEELKILDLLAQVDPEKGVYYKSEYIRVNDSITKKQRESREKFTRIEYETNRIEDANEVLTNKNLLLLLGLSGTVVLFLLTQIIRSRIAVKKERLYRYEKEEAEKEILLLTAEFHKEVVKSRKKEQDRISKELHDNIVNEIYGIRMILGSLNTQSGDEAQKKRLVYIKDLHRLETEIRTLSHQLYDNLIITEDSFDFLLQQLIAKNNAIGKSNFIYDNTLLIKWEVYSSIIQINIYRILQELFLNVNKYAHTKNCYLFITEIEDLLIINVKDDGVGFDMEATNNGIGLKNIIKRAKTINADLVIRSELNAGVEVNLKIKK